MATPRIHCHSAFKHYQIFHSHQSSGYENSIFNTTYNFNGGSICGGGFWGGLFGGLGMGLGAGLMNFLGGGMGMFGGGMGMFGGGMGMFGGGFPMMNMFGGNMFGAGMWNWGGSSRTDGAGGKNKSSECDDPDRKKLSDFNNREEKLEDDLKAKKDGSIDTLKKLYKEVVAAQKDSKNNDDHKNTDSIEYNTLIARLKRIAAENNLEDKDGELVEKSTPEIKPKDNNNDNDNNKKVNNNAGNKNNANIEDNNNKKVNEPKNNKSAASEESDEIKAAAKLEYNTKTGIQDHDIAIIEEEDISKLEFDRTIDNSGNTKDVIPHQAQAYEYSKEKFNGTKFPLYIVVKTKEQTYRYKCTKTLNNDKVAIYSTPKSDTNNNSYCLTIRNGKLTLVQPKSLTKANGYGVSDTQNDGSAEDILNEDVNEVKEENKEEKDDEEE